MQTRPVGQNQADFKTVAAIKNAIFPDEPVTANQLRYEREHWKEGFLFRAYLCLAVAPRRADPLHGL